MRVINKSNLRYKCGAFVLEVGSRPVVVPKQFEEVVRDAVRRFPADLEIDKESEELDRLRAENARLRSRKGE